MTNEGIFVRLYLPQPQNGGSRSSQRRKSGTGGGGGAGGGGGERSWDAVVAVATQTDGDPKLNERISFHQEKV